MLPLQIEIEIPELFPLDNRQGRVQRIEIGDLNVLGIVVVGHRYWLWQASRAESEGARRESLGRVLGATQYGVNQAESYVRGLQDRRVRMRLWRTLIDMAPNETWVQQYTRDLLSEAELCGPGPE